MRTHTPYNLFQRKVLPVCAKKRQRGTQDHSPVRTLVGLAQVLGINKVGRCPEKSTSEQMRGRHFIWEDARSVERALALRPARASTSDNIVDKGENTRTFENTRTLSVGS